MNIKVRVKFSRYRPRVAQRVGRGLALLYHDLGTRSGWVVSSTSRPHFTHGKVLVPILQEAGWAPGSVWTGGKTRPHRDSIPDRPACSQSVYRLSYPAHVHTHTHTHTYIHTHVYKEDNKHPSALYDVHGLLMQEWLVGDSYTGWQLPLWLGSWLNCEDHSQRRSGVARLFCFKFVMNGPFAVQT